MNAEESFVLNAFAIPLDVGLSHLADLVLSKSKVAMIGEQSHGTQEFYVARCELAKHVITRETNVCFVVLEASVVEAKKINDFVTLKTDVLEFSDEFPAWLWHNAPSKAFFDFCRTENTKRKRKVEIVGMDLYRPDPSAGSVESAIKMNRDDYLASLAAAAHARYVASGSSWNVRDSHMGDVIGYLLEVEPDSRVIVFAHNSHVLDYRATDRANVQISVGQIGRERFDAFLIMQSTFTGSVRAARDWGQADEVFEIENAASNSLSFFLHHNVELKSFVFDLDSEIELRRIFQKPMSSRAIGVVYKAEQENLSHYFDCIHASACHALIHIDKTTALQK